MGYSKTVALDRRKAKVVLVASLIAVLALATAASAQTGPPPSAVDAYRESIPTSSGVRPVGAGSGQAIPLSAKAQARLAHAGAAGSELKRIATSPALGAPTTRLRPVPTGSRNASVGRGLAAAARTLGNENDHMLALVAALALTAAASVGAAIVRSRGSRR